MNFIPFTVSINISTRLSANTISKEALITEISDSISECFPKKLEITESKIEFSGSGHTNSWVYRKQYFPEHGRITISEASSKYQLRLEMNNDFTAFTVLLICLCFALHLSFEKLDQIIFLIYVMAFIAVGHMYLVGVFQCYFKVKTAINRFSRI